MATDEQLTEYAQNLEEARRQLGDLEWPVERALARKAILQADILGFPESAAEFETGSPLEIGIFRVFPTQATINWVSPSRELIIKAGQTYLDFHMPKSDNISNKAADEGYSQIAEYMKSDPEISHIMGITYRIMALSAKRNQGFNTEEIQLPELVMNYAAAFWQNMIPDAKSRQFQTAHVVWQDREAFIGRFGK